jgi:hypothetical protein
MRKNGSGCEWRFRMATGPGLQMFRPALLGKGAHRAGSAVGVKSASVSVAGGCGGWLRPQSSQIQTQQMHAAPPSSSHGQSKD